MKLRVVESCPLLALKAEFAQALRDHRAALQHAGELEALVFSTFPSDEALHADLRRAGVERKDASGRVVHFHAFRKTFQSGEPSRALVSAARRKCSAIPTHR